MVHSCLLTSVSSVNQSLLAAEQNGAAFTSASASRSISRSRVPAAVGMPELSLGAYVAVSRRVPTGRGKESLGSCGNGYVKYIGELQGRSGRWYGVQLDEPIGHNNGNPFCSSSTGALEFGGTGRRYFVCRPLHGVFVRRGELQEVFGRAQDWNTAPGLDRHALRHRHDSWFHARWMQRALASINSAQSALAASPTKHPRTPRTPAAGAPAERAGRSPAAAGARRQQRLATAASEVRAAHAALRRFQEHVEGTLTLKHAEDSGSRGARELGRQREELARSFTRVRELDAALAAQRVAYGLDTLNSSVLPPPPAVGMVLVTGIPASPAPPPAPPSVIRSPGMASPGYASPAQQRIRQQQQQEQHRRPPRDHAVPSPSHARRMALHRQMISLRNGAMGGAGRGVGKGGFTSPSRLGSPVAAMNAAAAKAIAAATAVENPASAPSASARSVLEPALTVVTAQAAVQVESGPGATRYSLASTPMAMSAPLSSSASDADSAASDHDSDTADDSAEPALLMLCRASEHEEYGFVFDTDTAGVSTLATIIDGSIAARAIAEQQRVCAQARALGRLAAAVVRIGSVLHSINGCECAGWAWDAKVQEMQRVPLRVSLCLTGSLAATTAAGPAHVPREEARRGSRPFDASVVAGLSSTPGASPIVRAGRKHSVMQQQEQQELLLLHVGSGNRAIITPRFAAARAASVAAVAAACAVDAAARAARAAAAADPASQRLHLIRRMDAERERRTQVQAAKHAEALGVQYHAAAHLLARVARGRLARVRAGKLAFRRKLRARVHAGRAACAALHAASEARAAARSALKTAGELALHVAAEAEAEALRANALEAAAAAARAVEAEMETAVETAVSEAAVAEAQVVAHRQQEEAAAELLRAEADSLRSRTLAMQNARHDAEKRLAGLKGEKAPTLDGADPRATDGAHGSDARAEAGSDDGPSAATERTRSPSTHTALRVFAVGLPRPVPTLNGRPHPRPFDPKVLLQLPKQTFKHGERVGYSGAATCSVTGISFVLRAADGSPLEGGDGQARLCMRLAFQAREAADGSGEPLDEGADDPCHSLLSLRSADVAAAVPASRSMSTWRSLGGGNCKGELLFALQPPPGLCCTGSEYVFTYRTRQAEQSPEFTPVTVLELTEPVLRAMRDALKVTEPPPEAGEAANAGEQTVATAATVEPQDAEPAEGGKVMSAGRGGARGTVVKTGSLLKKSSGTFKRWQVSLVSSLSAFGDEPLMLLFHCPPPPPLRRQGSLH